MLVTYQLLPIQSRTELIHTHSFLYISYFRSYYGNPILSPYVAIWVGFYLPQIEPIYICAQ